MTTDAILRAFGGRPFTLKEAQHAGLTRSALLHQVRHQRLVHLHRGVYQVPAPPNLRNRMQLAALVHPDAVFSHDSAAYLHGLWCPSLDGWSRVTMTAAFRGGRSKLATFTMRTLDPKDITTLHGLRCTTPARTALDIAATCGLPGGLVMVDSYGRLQQPSRRTTLQYEYRHQIQQELHQVAQRMTNLRGIANARRAIRLTNPAAESPPESYARGLIITAGLPEPQVGLPIEADGRTYYADLSWPDQRLIVEIDGALKYQTQQDLLAEKRREDNLRSANLRVIRVLASSLWTDPHKFIARLRQEVH